MYYNIVLTNIITEKGGDIMKINKFFLVLPLLLFLAFTLGCDSDHDGNAQDDVGEPEDRPSILGYEVITEEMMLECDGLICKTEKECPSGKKLIYAGYVIASPDEPTVPVLINNEPLTDGSGVTFTWISATLQELKVVLVDITLICAFAESD